MPQRNLLLGFRIVIFPAFFFHLLIDGMNRPLIAFTFLNKSFLNFGVRFGAIKGGDENRKKKEEKNLVYWLWDKLKFWQISSTRGS